MLERLLRYPFSTLFRPVVLDQVHLMHLRKEFMYIMGDSGNVRRVCHGLLQDRTY